MRHIVIPEEKPGENRRLPFYLATEEWVARHLPEGDYFFSWRVKPTVICGRNQEIDKEVNLEYCRERGIDVVRRRSGGGCVYADRQNFMFSYITASDKVTEVFSRYTNMIAGCLRKIGINAQASGRNDILIDELKVSGNAFYHIPGRSIAHGTMLYDFDPEPLMNALTPSKAKLESKGVKSVQKRVTCLKEEGISLSPEEFNDYMITGLTDNNPYIITDKDIEEIKRIEECYYDPSFLRIGIAKASIPLDKNHVTKNEMVRGLGEFCVEYDLDRRKVIHDFSISGDFFMSGDVDKQLCQPFNGVRLDNDEVRSVIKEIAPENIIPGLDSATLFRLVTGYGASI